MKTITTNELATVTGGTATNDAVTQQLTALSGSIKDLASAQAKPADNGMMPMMMMMAMRPQPQQTVVAAPAAAAAPVINVDTRVRRW
jgi:bacteriocin-like protein